MNSKKTLVAKRIIQEKRDRLARLQVQHNNILQKLLDAGKFEEYYKKMEQFECTERCIEKVINMYGRNYSIENDLIIR